MSTRARRAAASAAVILCASPATPALAQQGGEPFSQPPLKGEIRDATPTPTETATASATRTPTPEPSASPTPTATVKPGKNAAGNLPATGSDATQVGLIGLSLLGFGLSLRFRVALADARSRD